MKKRLMSIVCLILFLSLFIYLPLPAQEKIEKVNLKGFPEFINKIIEIPLDSAFKHTYMLHAIF